VFCLTAVNQAAAGRVEIFSRGKRKGEKYMINYLLSHLVGAIMVLSASLIVLWFVYSSIVVVGGTQIAILERRWLGKKMPAGRVIAASNEVGVQGRTLGPGLHFLIPFLYKTTKEDFTVIKDGEIGLIESIDGTSIPAGKIFAKVVTGHNSFQDAESFLKNGGEKGPQIEVIPPGNYRINPRVFKITKAQAVKVEQGKVGVVTSQDGQAIDAGRLLAKQVEGHSNYENGDAFLKNGGQKGPQIQILLPGTYRINLNLFRVQIGDAVVVPSGEVGQVTARDGEPLPETEYVAHQVQGHEDYQNASGFLHSGGQRGPQYDVLRPGMYYINPLMFDVVLDEVATVQRGQVAVLVSNVGEEPPQVKEGDQDACEDRLDKGLERYVVPKGFRGVQQEVAGPGIYYLNRRAYIPYIIDTTNITIDWDETKDQTNFDSLKVISKDGFDISVSVKVIIRVRPDQAPYMVAKIGSIENLVAHVIHPMIDSSFRNQASSTGAMNFLQDREVEQKKAEDRARAELEKYHVDCISVLICQIRLPQALMDTQTSKIIAEQKKAMYAEQQLAEEVRITTEKTTAEANLQQTLKAAEINVMVADQNKKAAILNAEGEGTATRLTQEGVAAGIEAVGKAEGAAIKAKGMATAEAYDAQNKAIGKEGVTAIQVADKIAGGNVKIVPEMLITGNGVDGTISGFLASLMMRNKRREEPPVKFPE
jgi:uncharacterized membrane protein YqiK